MIKKLLAYQNYKNPMTKMVIGSCGCGKSLSIRTELKELLVTPSSKAMLVVSHSSAGEFSSVCDENKQYVVKIQKGDIASQITKAICNWKKERSLQLLVFDLTSFEIESDFYNDEAEKSMFFKMFFPHITILRNCSIFIDETTSVIDETAIEYLSYITEMSRAHNLNLTISAIRSEYRFSCKFDMSMFHVIHVGASSEVSETCLEKYKDELSEIKKLTFAVCCPIFYKIMYKTVEN